MTQSPTTQREVERKLRVHALFRLPDLVGAETTTATIEPMAVRSMTAVYHDTPSLRLFRWGVTLRRRTGGNDEGWHMKLPVPESDAGTRDEVHLPLSAGEVGDVPEALADIVTALVRGEELRPIVTLRTTRTPYLLRDESGLAFAELVDDSVSVLDDGRVVEQFREIEVEALTDDATPLDGVVTALIAAGARPSSMSKAASAIGPQAAEPPDVDVPEWPGRKDSASAALQCYFATQVQRLLLQDVRVRRDLPDAVHQMRVAARRLRTALRVFRPMLDAEWADGLRDELAWLAGELGHSRDAEVLEQRLLVLVELLPDDLVEPTRDTIAALFAQRLTGTRMRVLATLRSERHRALLDRLVLAATAPPFTEAAQRPCDDALPEAVDAAYSRLKHRIKALDAHGTSEDWHDARIAAKRARYAAESTAPVLGSSMRSLAEALEQVTEVLGEHQDAAIAQAEIVDLAGATAGSSSFALGILYADERGKEFAARRELARIWPSVKRAAKKALP